jgi:serine/threonine-protein kinase ULK/ATG1
MDAAAKRPDGLIRRRSSRTSTRGRPVSALTSVASQGVRGSSSSPLSYSPPFALSATPPFVLPAGTHQRPPSLHSLSTSPNLQSRSRPMLVPSATTNAVTTYGGAMTYHQAAHEAVFAESPPPGSSAWARAMGIAGMKLLGSPVNALGQLSRRPWRQARLSLTFKEDDPAEEALMTNLEDLAQKAHVLFEFADSKLAQCMYPSKASPGGGLSGTGTGFSPNSYSYFQQQSAMSRRRSSSGSTSSMDINVARMETLCAEAMVLYLKSLGFLQNGVEQAKQFWEGKAAVVDVVKTSAEFNESMLGVYSSVYLTSTDLILCQRCNGFDIDSTIALTKLSGQSLGVRKRCRIQPHMWRS